MKKPIGVTLTVLFVAVILGCGGIAKAPKDKEAAPGENRPVVQKSDTFDPNDPSKSMLWLVSTMGKINAEKGSGNLMVEKSPQERLKELLASVEGQKVRWPAGVVSVTREGVVYVNVSGVKLSAQEARWALPGAKEKTDYVLSWEPVFPKPTPKRKGEAVGAGGVTSPDKEWLKTLRKGDKVVLAATIKRISPRHTNVEEYAPPRRGEHQHSEFWQVHFEDAVLEPK
jgi:hypothetical protein